MRTVFANAFEGMLVMAAFACFIGGGWGAVTAQGGAKSEPTGEWTVLVSVNRTNKGDQLSPIQTSSIRLKSLSSPALLKRPPLGCDPVASSLANPLLAHIYKRCLV
jgi:hypothetical protein